MIVVHSLTSKPKLKAKPIGENKQNVNNNKELLSLHEDSVYQSNLKEYLSNDSDKSKILSKLLTEKSLNFQHSKSETVRLNNVKTFWNEHTKVDEVAGNQKLRDIDEKNINILLDELEKKKLINPKNDYLFELAAGVGRITKNIFVKRFGKIDALEPAKPLADQLTKLKKDINQIKNVYVMKAEDFKYDKKYNVVFASWFLENLTDSNALKFLIDTRKQLEKNGVIILKENISRGPSVTYKEGMAQRIRSVTAYETLFDLAGYKLLINRNSKGWPVSFYMVREFVLADNSTK
jgi:protein N-terminal methyltransferase